MAVAALGTNETDTRLAQRPLEAEVAHQRADHRPVQATAGLPVAGQHEQQAGAVADHPVAVDEQHPVAVAVEGDAQPRTRLRSEEHTSESQTPMSNSFSVFCLKKNN